MCKSTVRSHASHVIWGWVTCKSCDLGQSHASHVMFFYPSGVPAPSSVTTTPSVVIAAQDNSDEKTISTTEVMATTSHAPSPSPSPSPSPTPTGRPLRQYVSVHFDRDTFVVESGVTVAVLDVVLNSTVMEALCVVAVTRDGSAVGE